MPMNYIKLCAMTAVALVAIYKCPDIPLYDDDDDDDDDDDLWYLDDDLLWYLDDDDDL